MANNQIALLAQTPVFDTPFESQGKALQLRQMMNQGQVQDMDMQQRRQAIADDQQTRDISSRFGDPGQRIAELYKVNPKAAMAMQTFQQGADKSAADIGQIKANTQKTQSDVINQKMTRGKDMLNTVNDPQSAARWVQGMFSDPDLAQVFAQGGDTVEQAIARIPLDPQKFAEWRQASQLGAEKLIQMTTPDANARLTAQTSTDNNAATNAASRANNAATVGASYANANATRAVAASNVTAAGMRRDQDTEMKLSDDYRAQSKDFKAVGDAYKQISATLDKATTSPAATLAAATKFMKLLDPGSVVRESELGMALAATGAFDRATNYVNTLRYGKVLTKDQAKDFKNITEQIYGAAQQGQQAVDANYRRQAEAYKLRPEMVIQDLGQNTPAAGGKPSASNW